MSEIVAEAVRTNLAKQYAEGFMHGILETLDQLENRSARAPGGGYPGELSDDLKAWIATVRAQAEAKGASL